MSSRGGGWLHWMLLALLVGSGWIYLTRAPERVGQGTRAPQAGFLAPEWTVTTLEGEPVTLDSLRGRVILLNFWASWCGPCRAEMPAIQRIADQFDEREVAIVLVNTGESPATARAFLESLELRLSTLLDPDDVTVRRYQVQAMPTTFFIDRGGRITDVTIGGPMTESYLRIRLESLAGSGR